MVRIYKYRKVTDAHTTHCLVEPSYDTEARITELCTIAGETYVSVPDGITLPQQPDEITVEAVELTEELAAAIKSASAHTGLINDRVVARIRERYSITDEIKMLRIGPSPETEAYNDWIEACRAWGRAKKEKLMGAPMPSEIAAEATQAAKVLSITDDLPTWKAVSDAIDAAFTNAGQRTIVKKMARVLYWDVKGTEA